MEKESNEKQHFYIDQKTKLRYGVNPHQQASFYGNLDGMLTQLHGKKISYNNFFSYGPYVTSVSSSSTSGVFTSVPSSSSK